MIGSRVLTFRSASGDSNVAIRIFSPERDKSGAWSCKYEIDWPDGKHEMAAWGTDSVQAIFVAYQMIGSELYTSDYHKAGQLFFEAPGQGYGFPVPNNIRDLLEGDDARYL